MRKIKELLELLLKKVKDNGVDSEAGLCWISEELWITEKIDHNESDLILDYIKENKPKFEYEGHFRWGWQPGLIEPRIKWLEKQIKEIS